MGHHSTHLQIFGHLGVSCLGRKRCYHIFALRSLTSVASNRHCWKVIRHSDILCLYTRTKMVVSFANIFIAEIETKLNQQSETKPRE